MSENDNGNKPNLLIVDGEPANITILTEILGCDYNIRAATNGTEALEIAFSAEPPDLVLLAIKMPGMDGYEVCQKIKSDLQTKNIPIIFLTGKNSEHDAVKGLAAGAADYVTKPYSAAVIKARVNSQIRLKKSVMEQRKTMHTLKSTLDAIPDLLFEVGADGYYYRCHSPNSGLLYAPIQEQLGKRIPEVLPPAASAIVMSAIEEAGQKGVSFGKCYQLDVPAGKCWFEISAACRENSLTDRRFILLIRDITERKWMEKKIEHSADIQQVLREIVEISVQPSSMEELYQQVHLLVNAVLPAKNFFISLTDEETGDLVRPFCAGEMTDLPKRRGPKKGLTEYVIRQGRAMHVSAEEFDRLYAVGEIDRKTMPANNWLIAPLIDSQAKSFGVIAINLPDDAQPEQTGNVDVLSIIARQVALSIERKLVEAQLRRSYAAIHEQHGLIYTLFENLPIGVFLVEAPSGKPLLANQQALKIMGPGLVAEVAKENLSLAYRAFKAGSDEPYPVEELPILIGLKGEASHIDDMEIVCPDGTRVLLEVFGSPVKDHQGKVWASLVSFLDISERKRHERALKISYERRRKSDLMNELIRGGANSSQEVFQSALTLGANMLMPFTCFLLVIEEYKGKPREYWLEQLNEYRLLQDAIQNSLEQEQLIAWEAQEGIGVLSFEAVPATNAKEQQKKMAEDLRLAITRQVPELTLSFGISEIAANLSVLRSHYRQAKIAVNAGQKLWPQSKNYHYSDMGVFQLLSRFTDEEEIAEYIERTLGKILVLEKKKREAYLDTLEIILMSDNQKEGAVKLAIHYKTLMFRKHRIEKILAVSFDDFSARMAILTALHLLKLHKH